MMGAVRVALVRIRALVRRRKLDRDLDDEIASHLQLHIDDNLRAGMTPEEARRQALLALGGVEATKERYREQRARPGPPVRPCTDIPEVGYSHSATSSGLG